MLAEHRRDVDPEEAVSAAFKADSGLRLTQDALSIGRLKLLRGHHIENGGVVFDMAKLAPHLEATWADGIVLDNVDMTKDFYVHFGGTLEYDLENPASLIEGVYVTHVAGEEQGWMFTFVTNYPEWADAEDHPPSLTERRFGSTFSFVMPPSFHVAAGDYSALEIIGDRDLAAASRLWQLGRLATNAVLYLNRARPDVWGSLTTYSEALAGTNRKEIYDCGCDEIGWNIDWNDATLRPGRWRLVEPGGEGRPKFNVAWVPPQVVHGNERHSEPGRQSVVLQIRHGRRVPDGDGLK